MNSDTLNITEQLGNGSLLSLSFKEKAALHAAYMPFLHGGGLFIPTYKPLKMGGNEHGFKFD